MSEVLRVDAEKLQAAVAAIMEKEGVAPQDAAIVADSLVSAELTGLQSHGVQRVKFYTDSMEAGGTDPRCRIKTIRDFPGGALLDAQGALGIVAAYRAMELAIQKAKDVGIGIVNVRNSNHCSCTAYYIRMAAKENMLAIVSSNAPKSMAPWGSREKYLGTNPLAGGGGPPPPPAAAGGHAALPQIQFVTYAYCTANPKDRQVANPGKMSYTKYIDTVDFDKYALFRNRYPKGECEQCTRTNTVTAAMRMWAVTGWSRSWTRSAASGRCAFYSWWAHTVRCATVSCASCWTA